MVWRSELRACGREVAAKSGCWGAARDDARLGQHLEMLLAGSGYICGDRTMVELLVAIVVMLGSLVVNVLESGIGGVLR